MKNKEKIKKYTLLPDLWAIRYIHVSTKILDSGKEYFHICPSGSPLRQASTLGDLALLHLCIGFVSFFWKLEKYTYDSQQSAPFVVFLSNIYYASECCFSSMLCATTSLSAKEERKHVRRPTFFSFCEWVLRYKRHTVSLPKNKTRIHVFRPAFLNI